MPAGLGNMNTLPYQKIENIEVTYHKNEKQHGIGNTVRQCNTGPTQTWTYRKGETRV